MLVELRKVEVQSSRWSSGTVPRQRQAQCPNTSRAFWRCTKTQAGKSKCLSVLPFGLPKAFAFFQVCFLGFSALPFGLSGCNPSRRLHTPSRPVTAKTNSAAGPRSLRAIPEIVTPQYEAMRRLVAAVDSGSPLFVRSLLQFETVRRRPSLGTFRLSASGHTLDPPL